jgi:hypothetical protein
VADGIYYHDSLPPWCFADIASVTLATTDKALYPATSFPTFPSGFLNKMAGKKLTIDIFGRITTAATPGNGTFDVYWGTGADANGTILASSGTLALTASQTNVSWMLHLLVTVRAIGTSAQGRLLVTGKADFNVGVLASTLAPMLIPAATAADVQVDLTGTSIVSVNFKRSGSTAETMQIHDMVVSPLN